MENKKYVFFLKTSIVMHKQQDVVGSIFGEVRKVVGTIENGVITSDIKMYKVSEKAIHYKRDCKFVETSIRVYIPISNVLFFGEIEK